MADICETSSDKLSIDIKKEYLELNTSQSVVQETCQSEKSSRTDVDVQDEEKGDGDENQDNSFKEQNKVSVLGDIVQLIDLVNSSVTKDGTNGKTKYKDGFIFLENLQTQFEKIQEEVTEKDKMIVAFVIENCALKREANTSKEELNKKCQQFDELKDNFTKFQNEIESQKTSEKTIMPTISLESLKSTTDKLQHHFIQLKCKIERQGPSNNDLSSIQRNINIKTYQEDIEVSLNNLEQNISLLAKCQKKIVDQLEYTQTTLNKLNDICSETENKNSAAEPKSAKASQQQIILVPSTLQGKTPNIAGKPQSPVDSLPPQSKLSFSSNSGFNLNSIAIPTLPYFKPFSGGSKNKNDQYPKYPQQPQIQAYPITKPIISRAPLSFPLRPHQQQSVIVGKSKGHHNNLLIQQYPNLILQSQNKCLICGMTFFNSEQLKLHTDLVHHYKNPGSAEVTISSSSSMPYTPYSQRQLPNPSPLQQSQKHYHKHLWSTSQPTSGTKRKRMSTNPSSSSNQNAQKRHCAELFLNSSYPPSSIPGNMANSATAPKNH